MKIKVKQSIYISVVLILAVSCTSYNRKISNFYNNIKEEKYQQADQDLDKIKLLQKPRNRLLYLLEKGKVLFLLGKYNESNFVLNKADDLIEAQDKTIGDMAVGTIVNPMAEKYHAEDFEKFMVHYYKALNYLFLNNIEDAVVEARRISIQTNELNDKKSNNNNKYSKDAFSLIIQGLIYESDADMNNAFISYRNALDIYINQKDNSWYGVTLPKQLIKDVLNLALANGFYDEYQYISNKLNIKPNENDLKYHSSPGGDLIIFFENGLGPIKDQQEFFFTLIRGLGGNFYFQDVNGSLNIPIIIPSSINSNSINLNDIGTFRVAFPKWIPQPAPITESSITTKDTSYVFEKIEDLNILSQDTFKERFVSEVSQALSRLLLKKIAEYGVKNMGSDKNKGIFEAAGAAIQLYNLISEKADTRNWQTLPAEIYYARVPLKLGENKINISLKNRQGITKNTEITINSKNNKLKFYSFSIFH